MDFNSLFTMNDGDSSRQTQEAALWDAATAFTTNDFGAQQQQNLYATGGTLGQPISADIQMFSPTTFSTGQQSTLAERPSQNQMGPPRRRDQGPERKRARTGRDSAVDSVDYWMRDDDEETNGLGESFEINFAQRQAAHFQPRPPPTFNPLATTTPGLGTGQYTESVPNFLKPDDFIMDDSALDNALSEDDDLFDTMNLNDQLSKIDSIPPNPSNLPPRENLYSTPLSWEKSLTGNQSAQQLNKPGTNPPPSTASMPDFAASSTSSNAPAQSTAGPSVPSSTSANPSTVPDYGNSILSEAEQRRLLSIALNGNRAPMLGNFGYANPFAPGNPFLGNLGATMMNPATAQLLEQAFSGAGMAEMMKTPTGPEGSFLERQAQQQQQARKQGQSQGQMPQQQQQQQQPQQQDKGKAPMTAEGPDIKSESPSASLPAPPTMGPTAKSASVGPPPANPSKSAKTADRTAHNDIERKYRTNLKDKISELRDAVPALRGLVDEEDEDGSVRPQKVSKGTVLAKATEYIHYLERRNKAIMKEHQDLSRRLQAFEQLLNATARQPFLMPSYSRSLFDPRGFC